MERSFVNTMDGDAFRLLAELNSTDRGALNCSMPEEAAAVGQFATFPFYTMGGDAFACLHHHLVVGVEWPPTKEQQ